MPAVVSAMVYSAALCRGLIEARKRKTASLFTRRIPRLYAAASLKQEKAAIVILATSRCIPRLYAAASLKRHSRHQGDGAMVLYSAALCRGLIEAPTHRYPYNADNTTCIPRLYAAASLKLAVRSETRTGTHRIPRLYAAASLKPRRLTGAERGERPVFRGFMPRPH